MSELNNLGLLTVGPNVIIAVDTTTADVGLDESTSTFWRVVSLIYIQV